MTRRKGTDYAIEERLDRAFGTNAWLGLFSLAKLTNMVAHFSDHSPTLLSTVVSPSLQRFRSFKFENSWCREEGVYEVVG